MNRNVSERLDELVDVNRRGLLKGLTAGSVTGFSFPAGASTGDSVEIAIEQNGEEIVRRLEQTLDRMGHDDKGNGKSIDNRVTSVINQFESVVNTLENGGEPPLDARVRSEYLRRCRDANDLLESAIVAAE